MANDYNDKVSRVLSLYQRLMEGEVVDKEVEAARYGVSARSIQRDISAINNFFEQETEKSGVINSIEYDKKRGGHYLSQIYRTRLTNSEILAICKILLDSRAFTRERMEHILDILVDRCTPAEGKAIVQDLIKNEEFHYIELTHKSEFVDKMWDIGQARCLVDFANVERQGDIPELEAQGDTAMGEGVNLALDLLERRKQEYKDKGVDYYQPWLVLMTDGVPNGSNSEYMRAVQRTVDMVNSRKLTIFPIAIGDETDLSALNKFSPKRPALKLQGLKFGEFFSWLSKSVSKTSQSTPGESVKLDPVSGWAEL